MDLFHNAKAVRLKSHHDKYLVAEEDEESVTQDRNGSARNARWTVEFSGDHSIRLKSCYGKYLTATNHAFLLGMTGKRVLQTGSGKPGKTMEWEPLKAGSQTRLRTREGTYLRANGGLPPWRNSITHDLPHRTATQGWVLWSVDIVEILDHSVDGDEEDEMVENPGRVDEPEVKRKPSRQDSQESPVRVEVVHSEPGLVSVGSDKYQRQESTDFATYSPPKPDGRLIYYHIADEQGNVDAAKGSSLIFKGHSVSDLTRKLVEETGLEDIYVCTRSPLNGKLYPLRLQLPPNSATMHIVVVPSTSSLAQDFL